MSRIIRPLECYFNNRQKLENYESMEKVSFLGRSDSVGISLDRMVVQGGVFDGYC